MSKNYKKSIIGLLFIVLAGLILASNFGFKPADAILDNWWPIVIIILGLLMLTKNKASWVWSLLTIGIGATLLVENITGMDVNLSTFIVPVILLALGFSIILGNDKKHLLNIKNDNDVDDITAILSGSESVNTSKDYKGGVITAIMGGVELDLSKAVIDKAATLNVTAIMGGIELRVADDVIVKNKAMCLLGGIEDKTKPNANAKAPILYIDGTVIMGGIEIKR